MIKGVIFVCGGLTTAATASLILASPGVATASVTTAPGAVPSARISVSHSAPALYSGHRHRHRHHRGVVLHKHVHVVEYRQAPYTVSAPQTGSIPYTYSPPTYSVPASTPGVDVGDVINSSNNNQAIAANGSNVYAPQGNIGDIG